MSKFDPIIDLISKSKITVIGYKNYSEIEPLMDEMRLCDFGEFDINTSLIYVSRKKKIGFILNETEDLRPVKGFYFDVMKYKVSSASSQLGLDRSKEIKIFLQGIINDEDNIIIIAPIYMNSFQTLTLYGGNSLMYAATLVVYMIDHEISVVKNRINGDFIKIKS